MSKLSQRTGLVAGAFVIFTAAAVAQSPAAAPATDPVVITAGSQQIHASQFAALLQAAPAANRASMLGNKRAVAQQLAQILALANEAEQQGMAQTPAFKLQMLMTRDQSLAQALLQKLEAEGTPTDAQVQGYYAAHPALFRQTKVRHILIGDSETQGGPNRTPAAALAKAEKIEAELKAGGNFATLARTESDDESSKAKGGELGEILPGQTMPAFQAAVDKLPVGQISPPIHTSLGYHIIEVEGRSTMPLAQAKSLIVQQLTAQSVDSAIQKITAGAHIVISDSYFGPAPTAPSLSQPAAPAPGR